MFHFNRHSQIFGLHFEFWCRYFYHNYILQCFISSEFRCNASFMSCRLRCLTYFLYHWSRNCENLRCFARDVFISWINILDRTFATALYFPFMYFISKSYSFILKKNSVEYFKMNDLWVFFCKIFFNYNQRGLNEFHPMSHTLS